MTCIKLVVEAFLESCRVCLSNMLLWWLSIKPGESEGNGKAGLKGIAMDAAGNVLVGCITEPYYISKHAPDGLHVHSFNVSIALWFLAVTAHDNVIVSDGGKVGIVSQTGETLHMLTHPDMSVPAGVHYTV